MASNNLEKSYKLARLSKESMESFSATTERIDIGDETENHDDVISPDSISVGQTESSVLMHLFETRTEQVTKIQVDPSKKAKSKNNEKVYEKCFALPVSYCLPGSGNTNPMDRKAMKRKYEELMESESEARPLTMEERKMGYIEETRVRCSDKRKDKYYYHVESEQKFRSLKEVHEYIKFGDEQGVGSKKVYKGETYLKSQIIGSFDFETKSILHEEEQTDESGVNIDEERMEEDAKGESDGGKRTRTTYALRIGRYMNFEFVQK